MEWQPIETAPKDGTEILAFEDGQRFVTKWCEFRDGFGELYHGWIEPNAMETGPYPCDPTHWMPLAPPPAEQGE